MGFFSRSKPAAPAAAETETSKAREILVSDLARRINSADRSARARADQVGELPGGKEIVAEAVRRAAVNQWRR